MTKQGNGADVVDLKTKFIPSWASGTRRPEKLPKWARWAHTRATVQLEQLGRSRETLALLTCSICGKRQGRGLDGFLDHQFMTRIDDRCCFSCLKKEKSDLNQGFLLDGNPKMWCHVCEEVKDEKATPKQLVHRLRQVLYRYRHHKARDRMGSNLIYSLGVVKDYGLHICQTCHADAVDRLGDSYGFKPFRTCRLRSSQATT